MGFSVGSVPAGSLVDTACKLSPAQVDAVRAAGYLGIIRYVPLPGVGAGNDIDAAELNEILGAGLGLMLVQHCRYEGWDPSTVSGATDAASAISTAKAAGYLPGAHIFVDLEGVKVGVVAEVAIAFVNAWAAAIVDAGYSAGCYVGYDVPLTPAQLYDLPQINTYWSDVDDRSVATRGCAMKQGKQIVIAGAEFDPDTVAVDGLGQTPRWMLHTP